MSRPLLEWTEIGISFHHQRPTNEKCLDRDHTCCGEKVKTTIVHQKNKAVGRGMHLNDRIEIGGYRHVLRTRVRGLN